MEKTPIIRQGWLRALIFLIVFTLVVLSMTRFSPVIFEAAGLPSGTEEGDSGFNQLPVFFNLLLSSIAAFITVLLFRKLIDRDSISSLGFNFTNYRAHAATGFFLGPLLIGIGSFVFILSRQLEWTDIQPDPRQLFITLGMMLIIAFAEELVFRGYLLNNLLQSMNKWIALLVSALVFAFFHSNNPEINVIAMVNIFLGGLLLGINYIYTKNLWFGILFHFTWNFYQGGILGYDVSGIRMNSLVQQQRSGSTWFTGGDFGFEGSLICTIVCIAALLLLAWVYEKKIRLVEK